MAFEAIDELLQAAPADPAWESFHENSKFSRHERHSIFALPPSDATVVRAMNRLRTVKPYRDYAKLPLPADLPVSDAAFDDVAQHRVTARHFDASPMDLPQLAKVLHFSYGITRDNQDTHYPRPFRAVPSGGALYPLNIYASCSRPRGCAWSLPLRPRRAKSRHPVGARRSSDHRELLFQPELAAASAAVLFVSATFMRSTFKYGDRGYRFALIEAGHVAQNALLSAPALGLAGAPIGGYLDREVDRYLGLDGLNESVIYMLLLGGASGTQLAAGAARDSHV